MSRIERGKTGTIDQPFYVGSTLTDADGAVTVTITRADGSVLATTAATTNVSTGVYRYLLAAQTTLDLLTFTYTGTWGGNVQTETQQVEIVGDFYLSVAECRALDSRFSALAVDVAARVRADVEDAIEAEAGVAFVSRFARETLDGRGTTSLLLGHMYPTAVRSLRTYTSATAYTAHTVDDLAAITYAAHGQIGSWLSTYAYGSRNLVVEYEHGLTSPPPLIRRAARALFKTWMLEDLAAANNDLANVRSLSVEGYSRSFFEDVRSGNKTVDQLIDEWKRSTTPAGVAVA